MKLNMFKSKIHRATVTHADLDYEGSVTIDSELMELAKIYPYEAVHIWNITRGSRIMTYALPGPAGSRIVGVNGAAAHLNFPGDMVILATFAEIESGEMWNGYKPTVVLVDKENRLVSADHEETALRKSSLP